jgi:hypothetical protein
VTEPDLNQLEQPESSTAPSETGNPAVDDALRGLADLASAPLSEHHDRLAKAQEMLQEALDRGDEDRSGNAD